ncbi:GNAT family N-acetyltransferase [Aquincola sp. J276]|uniref:GNAT family N-acetyltransferase n=1 Tax=Aquincola sp. J276 TaxID=2898432 RepID=UPI002150BA2F|nr:GNAT family N-acetyltransferase [Aquincola sp. J276]MCR5866323.1 GNAT family N-acetyltransferase [Aquincola sp. J276]
MSESPRIELVDAATPALLEATRGIFREYAEQLGVDLCFQNFDAELASLPGDYAPPAGALLLVFVDDELAGCGGFRPLPESDYPNACEMKRLYVRRAFRRFGLGRLLAQALMDRALQAGYSSMLLDTLDDMEAARGLYSSLGFEEIPPYYFNPLPGSHYLRVQLG